MPADDEQPAAGLPLGPEQRYAQLFAAVGAS